jgi:RNA polymerase sigma-B factor
MQSSSAHDFSHPAAEHDAFIRWHAHGDRRAREELVKRYLPLARKLAMRYVNTPESLEDLVQVASVGLLNAIDRFDPTRGVGFTGYAAPTILGELKRHFRDKRWSVHVPRALQELALHVRNAEQKLSAASGRSPTLIEVAEYLEVDVERVIEAHQVMSAHHTASLDAPIASGEDEAKTPHDTIGAEDEHYSLIESAHSLASALELLPEGDRRIFEMRFRDDLTQSEIAARTGVSQMQVSRMLRRITDQLRQTMGVEPMSRQRRTRRKRTSSV